MKKLKELLEIESDKNFYNIIFIDFDNVHGEKIYSFIQNILTLAGKDYQAHWIKIKSFTDLWKQLDILKNIENTLFCLPFCWKQEDKNVKNLLNIISWKNIIICSKDEEYLYPWSYSFVIAADIDIKCKDFKGTSFGAAVLALIILLGEKQLISLLKNYKQ